LTAVVVLPTPPFWFAMATNFFISMFTFHVKRRPYCST